MVEETTSAAASIRKEASCSGRVVQEERSAANVKIITANIRWSSLHLLFSAQISYFISNMESASSQQQRLSDLPIGALSHVSSYLPSLPSRAFFAVALNYYRDTDSCSAIVGDQWDVLDFGDIEKEQAVNLTDDDFRNILLSIDAVNNLKALRLTNCIKITGIGLEPLRGSTMIEKIDLSLVENNTSPDLSPAPPISCNEVLTILNSIIDMGGACSLKLLIFPKKWRKERSTDSAFHAFLVRYNALLRSRVVPCLNCNGNLEEGEMMRMEVIEYGTQNFTCYDCMKHYCHDCSEEDDGEIFCMSDVCNVCNRRYCFLCSREWNCTSCNGYFCVDCMATKQCAQCDENTCLNCISKRGCRNSCCEVKLWCNGCVHGGVMVSCENCGADCCPDCYDSNTVHVDSIDYCRGCDEILCGNCRVIKCKDGNGCMGCYRFAVPALLEDRERLRQEMQSKIEEQKRENSELKRKLEDMIGEGQKNNEGK